MELNTSDFYPNGRIKNQSIVSNGKPGMLLVKAEWCGHCKRFMPTFGQLANKLGRVFPLVFIDESNMSQQLSTALQVRGFPTLMFFDKYGRVFEVYDGPRDYSSLLRKIDAVYHAKH
jgi:thiol-disulfide isomerase/thioredoxin